MAISSIGIVTNQSPAAYQLAIESIGYLAEKVSEIFVEANLLLDIERRNSDIGQVLRVLDYSRRLDLLLVFGGDGTIRPKRGSDPWGEPGQAVQGQHPDRFQG